MTQEKIGFQVVSSTPATPATVDEFAEFDRLLQAVEAEAVAAEKARLENLENRIEVLQTAIAKAERVAEHAGGGEDKLPDQARQMLAGFRAEFAALEADQALQTFLTEKKAKEERAAREAYVRKERKAALKKINAEISVAIANYMGCNYMAVITSQEGGYNAGAVVLFHDGVDVIVERLLGDAQEGVFWKGKDGRQHKLFLYEGQQIATDGYIGAIDERGLRRALHPAIFKYLREADWVHPSLPGERQAEPVIGRGCNVVVRPANPGQSHRPAEEDKKKKKRLQVERAAKTFQLIGSEFPGQQAANE